MKSLVIFALVFFSLKMFANEVGEQKGTDCKHSQQSSSRSAKQLPTTQSGSVAPVVKTISK